MEEISANGMETIIVSAEFSDVFSLVMQQNRSFMTHIIQSLETALYRFCGDLR